MKSFIMRKPFDAHVHGRDGALLSMVAPMTAREFAGAIFEPNLSPPILTGNDARAYLARIILACADTPDFNPSVLLYLTDNTDPEMVYESIRSGACVGVKYYPRGATTNSDSGIADVSTLYTPGTKQDECIRAVGDAGGVVQLHCELNFTLDNTPLELDPYRKEAYFFDHVMPQLCERHPDVKLSCEHLTSKEGAFFMGRYGCNFLGCSITPHHLLLDRRDMFRGGLRPHLFCLPVIKAEEHREALIDLISEGYGHVYAGTDSAPHDRCKKEADCCSGGVFTAHAATPLYAQALDGAGLIEGPRFEEFMSLNGPRFYGIPASEAKIQLAQIPWQVDELIQYGANETDVIWPFGYDTKPENRSLFLWQVRDL
jgi:dihydroorotase